MHNKKITARILMALLLTLNVSHVTAQAIEEVIVTANKRAESLQEISSAVTALGGDTMEALNLQDFYDVADMTPGMMQRTEDEITIRGVGRIGGDASFASTVAVHENGFFLPRGAYWPFLDIGAVEITRGSSGAVFGRNATGGAINIKWRQPEASYGGWLDLTGGSYNYRRARGALNLPLRDDGAVLGRIAFLKQTQDGTLDNLLEPDELDGHNKDEWLLRGILSYEPSETLRGNLRLMRWERDNIYNYGRPSDHTLNSGFYEAAGAERPPPENNKVKSNIAEFTGGEPGHNIDTRLDADIDWLVAENRWLGDVELSAIVGRHELERRRVSDVDGSTTDIIAADQTTEGYTNNAELRLTTSGERGFDTMLGVFWAEYFEDYGGSFIRAILPIDAAELLFPGLSPVAAPVVVKAELDHLRSKQSGESLAAFGNTTVRLQHLVSGAPNIELFAGYRRNWDDVGIDSAVRTDVYIPSTAPVPVQSTVSPVDVTEMFKQDIWEAGLKWFVGDDHMLYLKRSKGYKAGAVEFASGELNQVAPELLFAWELGVKSAFFSRSLQLNLATFRYDYRDLQVLVHEGVEVHTENAATSEMNGVELELLWQPSAALSTQLTLAYLDARFTDYCTTDPTFPQGFTDPACEGRNGERDVSGNRVPNSAPWTATWVASYRFDQGALGSITPLIKVVWTDEVYTAANNAEPYRLPAFTQTDLHLTWQSPTERWVADLYVEHIENEDERLLNAISAGIPDALFFVTQLPPRMVGLRVGYTF